MTIELVDVQASLIARIKTMLDVLALLPDPLEIREIEWQGTNFSYPNVRVRVEEFERHIPNSSCSLFDVVVNVYVFGEDASSKLTNQIAGKLFNNFDTKSFTQGLVKFTGIKAKQFGATWIQEGGTWRSEVKLMFQAS